MKSPAQVTDLARVAHLVRAALAIDPVRAVLANGRKSELHLWSSGTASGP